MDRKTIAIITVGIIIVAAVGVVALTSNSGPRGWYAWDPDVGEVDYTEISMTPGIIDAIEDMYETAYGTLPAKGDGKIAFEPLVERTSKGIDVTSIIGKDAGKHTEKVSFTDSELSKTKIVSYGSGFTDCVYGMLGDGVWDKVVAAGNSTYTKYPDNTMANWSQSPTGSLGSEYFLSTENLISFLKYAGAQSGSDTYVLLMWGYTNADDVTTALSDLGYKNVKMICVDYYAMVSLEGVLAVMDMIGQIIGIDTDDNVNVNEFQSRLSGITAALADVPDDGRTAYMERADGKSPGSDTLADACFKALKLTNINGTSGTNKINDETVVVEKPDYIFFVDGDKRTMDQKMRVTV